MKPPTPHPVPVPRRLLGSPAVHAFIRLHVCLFLHLVDAPVSISLPFRVSPFQLLPLLYLSLSSRSTFCLPLLLSEASSPSASPCRGEAAGYQRVLQVDLEINGLMAADGGREVTWQVEYPLTRTLTSEVHTLVRLAPQDLGGIVPLAMVSGGGGRGGECVNVCELSSVSERRQIAS